MSPQAAQVIIASIAGGSVVFATTVSAWVTLKINQRKHDYEVLRSRRPPGA